MQTRHAQSGTVGPGIPPHRNRRFRGMIVDIVGMSALNCYPSGRVGMSPFVLRARRKLPREAAPSADQFYDPIRQVWVDGVSGRLAVEEMRYRPGVSKFGETTLTEAREGADQASESILEPSKFGETRITRSDEGADECGSADLLASKFGETTYTGSLEGSDRMPFPESFASSFGETTMTKSHGEGADHIEVLSDPIRYDQAAR